MMTDTALALRLPYTFAKRNGILLSINDNQVIAYWKLQLNFHLLQEIQRFSQKIITQHQILSSDDFEKRLAELYEETQQASAMMDDIHEELDLSDINAHLNQPEDLLEASNDAPIIRLINALLTEAIKENASDIHIDAFEDSLLVRFRVDGVLRDVLTPPRTISPLLVSRIKIMAKLDIAEKRLPQDGRISLRIAGRAVDVRVSTLPAGHGERVVMRLLDKREGILSLSDVGLSQEMTHKLLSLIHRPHGIFLVTGPTGSGKTTTLYSALSVLNDRKRNIMTIEDPIEYYLNGISQTQVNSKVEMTFARGLRAILRQDPDVVMIGEIRDLETAEIAIQASLTGHMVFSTLHTNSALGAVTRLRDMGVEPFLLSSSLLGVLAQRLVRTLCTHCKQPTITNNIEMEHLRLNAPQTIFHAQGCQHCNQTGYRGRKGLFELVIIDAHLKNMIHEGATENMMAVYAHQFSPGLFQSGKNAVLEGITTIEELLRVSHDTFL